MKCISIAAKYFRHHITRLHAVFLVPGILLVCIFLVIFNLLHGMYIHNKRLDVLASALYTTPLPPQTRELQRQATITNLGPVGDACDYIIQQTLETTLSQPDLLAYYDTDPLPSISVDIRTRLILELGSYYAMTINEEPAYLILPLTQPRSDRLQFMIQIVSGRYSEPFDLRCT